MDPSTTFLPFFVRSIHDLSTARLSMENTVGPWNDGTPYGRMAHHDGFSPPICQKELMDSRNFTKLSPHGFFLAEMFTAPAMEAGN
jgi:hypothetical protein